MSAKASMKVGVALDTPADKRAYNERLFTEVAPRYDCITRLLSFGRDAGWKREMIARLPPMTAPRCVDIACGTGDLTVLLLERYPDATITGLDLTDSMLDRARARIANLCIGSGGDAMGGARPPGASECEEGDRPARRSGPSPRAAHQAAAGITFVRGDMTRLEAADGTVDVVTGGYALRNAPDLDVVLREVARVLRPGGVAAFIDFSRPDANWRAWLNDKMLRLWGGFWGILFHRDPHVYGYIADSLARYPPRSELLARLRSAGFRVTLAYTRFLGFAEVVVGERAP